MNSQSMVRFLAFGAFVFMTNAAVSRASCLPFSGATASSTFPPSIFAIVWPVLYVILGKVWRDHPDQDVLFGLLTFLCCAWIVLRRCTLQRKWADATLALSAIVAVALLVNTSSMTMALPVGWLFFANIINRNS